MASGKRGSSPGRSTDEIHLDINTASAEELARLAGMSLSKADAVVHMRRSLGGFTSINDLMKVPGIGASVLDMNQAILTCSLPAGPSSSSAGLSVSSSPVQENSCREGFCWRRKKDAPLKEPTQCLQNEDVLPSGQDLPGPSQSASESPVARSSTPSHNKCAMVGNPNSRACFSSTSAIQEAKDRINCIASSVRRLLRASCPAELSHCEQLRVDLEGGEENVDDERRSEFGSDVEAGSSSECAEQDVEFVDAQADACPHHPHENLSCQERNLKPLTENNVVGLEKHHMKRKSERAGEVRGHSPEKKPCRTLEVMRLRGTASMADISQDSGIMDPEEEPPVREDGIEDGQTNVIKKRCPTKVKPPPELNTWLTLFQSWSGAERLVALDQLIEACEPSQVRHMMNVIEPQFQRDFISLLPKELALYVLSFLEPRDLLRAAQTCRYWRILAEDNLLWREKCREAGIDDTRDVLGKRRPRLCISCPVVTTTTVAATTNNPSNVIPSPWKAAYMRQHNIEMNWRFRPIRPPKVLKGHDDHVITCLQFSGNRIVSGSDDNTLKVWSATTGKCLRTLVGHTGGVWSSQMAGNIIISGSTDRTLKVWNADSGQCIHTLYGHTSTVRCMHLHGSRVVSGSRDATLRVWDIETGECLHVLVGHVAAVRCVQYNGKLVVSGAYDYMVKIWNPEREECLHTLQGHTNRVYSLQFDGLHVVSGSLDTSIRVWDVETGSCKHTLVGHQSLTSGMELRNNILVSGNADSTVKVWDILTGQCLQTLAGLNKHQSAVTCLQFNNKFVITSSDDGTVKLWDLKTGEFIRNLVALESGGSGGVVWRIRASPTKLVCAVGSRNGTEETKLLVLDFDVDVK